MNLFDKNSLKKMSSNTIESDAGKQKSKLRKGNSRDGANASASSGVKEKLKSKNDSTEETEENNSISGSASKKKKKTSVPPEIPSTDFPIQKRKRPFWESDTEREDGEEQEEEGDAEQGETQAAVKVVKKARQISVLQTKDVVELNACLSRDIKAFKKYIKSVNRTDEVSKRNELIDPDLYSAITMVLTTKFPGEEMGFDVWSEWTDDVFFERLLSACPDETTSSSLPGGLSTRDRILNTRLNFSVWNTHRILELHQSLVGLLKLLDDGERDEKKEENLVKLFLDELNKYDGGNKAKKRLLAKIQEKDKPKTFENMTQRMHTAATEMNKVCREAFTIGMLDPSLPEHRELFKQILVKDGKTGAPGADPLKKPFAGKGHGAPGTTSGSTDPRLCKMCGKPHTGLCSLRDHPDRNYSQHLSWADSRQGKAWAQKGESVLPHDKTLKGIPFKSAYSVPKKGDELFCATTEISHELDSDFVPCTVRIQGNSLAVSAFVDNGALTDNYVSRETADWLTSHGVKLCGCSSRVCSGFRNMCSSSLGKVSFELSFVNEITKSEETLKLTASVIESPFDVIIGRPSIKNYDLADKLRSQFYNGVVRKETSHGVKTNVDPTTLARTTLSTLHTPYIRKSKSELLDYEPDNDEIYEDSSEAPWDHEPSQANAEEPLPEIFGSESLQSDIRKLCVEFKDIFSSSLRPEPALLPPMELKVDLNKWQDRKNSRPARLQSKAKQYETLRQVNKMIANNVIKKSQATSFSQVLLTPKPNDKWRFCIDFRELNLCTDSMGWPIPNIKQMLQRIGDQRSEVYGVMDLTSGYHQAPVSLASQNFLAFIVFCGVFEWLRIPMGLKGAPSYFQQMMVTIVLVGLVYFICEVYMDDVIIHAKTPSEFIDRLRHVFDRFRKYRLTANPEKCRFGLAEIEYVGHLLDKDGLSFSKKKKAKVLDFPKPVYQKELKSFLGLANYFRDHVANHSTVVRPLNQMLLGYAKHSKLVWTEETERAFEEVKQKIGNCPKLFFVDESSPVYLHTDASDYGVGAYAFQIVEEVEVPIAFLSKSLVNEQLNWSTPEKEAYAIFFSFRELEYLLRDVHFLLRTDHKNLIFINEDGSPKVKRWKLAIQEYDFDIEHIPGKDNGVADAFSRLCVSKTMATLCPMVNPEEFLCVLAEFKIPKDMYRKISKVHNTFAGHHGVERTLAKLAQLEQSWPYMREHVKRFIRNCPCCQKMSFVKIPIHTHPFTVSTLQPNERINIDDIGPLPPDTNGNSHIQNITDTFSRHVELYATKSTTAKEAAVCLMDYIGRYGCPSQVLSDNGTQYVNDIIKELFILMGTEHVLTMAGSKEESGLVERSNKEVLRHLRAIMYHKNIYDNWSIYLPMVQRIINSTVNESIGVSPAQILFGNAVTLDRGIFVKQNEIAENERLSLSEWSADMLAKQATAIRVAQETQLKKNNLHFANYPAGELTEFPINSYVMVEYSNSSLKKGPPNKLMAYLRGPMRVVNFIGTRYTLMNLVNNKLEDFHVKLLHPFNYDPEVTDPRLVAYRDQQHFVVESIVAHTGDKILKSGMTFKVRWSGFEASDDTWLPWKELRTNAALHRYLSENNLKSLIPKGFILPA